MMRMFIFPMLAACAVMAAEPVDLPGIHNAFRATERIMSGSQPEGDASFAALARAGVRTVISVDGAKPDVEAARRHGLRYVHLPIGYDGVPASRVPELVKAAGGEGKVFVHCHHGKHRGPAAVGVICQALEGWSPVRAEEWLVKAGTSPDYTGLFRAVRDFSAPTAEQLAKVGALPEVAQTEDVVDAMVAIDDRFDALKAAQKAGWKTPENNPDATPAHQATLLWEAFREMARLPHTEKQPDEYRRHLGDSENLVARLRDLLREPEPDTEALGERMKAITKSCTDCHKLFRNVKQ